MEFEQPVISDKSCRSQIIGCFQDKIHGHVVMPYCSIDDKELELPV